jgi:Ran GTPase-activating protein (RanGAP) involved in mRNA processing and transport
VRRNRVRGLLTPTPFGTNSFAETRYVGAVALAGALERSRLLQTLDLRGNGRIGADGVASIAAAVEKSRSVTYLDLRGCEGGSVGARALAAALSQNVSVRTLNLQRNGIEDDGMVALAKMLEANCSLRSLDVSGNVMHTPGARALASVLEQQQNVSLTELDVSSNSFGWDGQAAFQRALEVCHTLCIARGVDSVATFLARNKHTVRCRKLVVGGKRGLFALRVLLCRHGGCCDDSAVCSARASLWCFSESSDFTVQRAWR